MRERERERRNRGSRTKEKRWEVVRSRLRTGLVFTGSFASSFVNTIGGFSYSAGLKRSSQKRRNTATIAADGELEAWSVEGVARTSRG